MVWALALLFPPENMIQESNEKPEISLVIYHLG